MTEVTLELLNNIPGRPACIDVWEGGSFHFSTREDGPDGWRVDIQVTAVKTFIGWYVLTSTLFPVLPTMMRTVLEYVTRVEKVLNGDSRPS